MIMATILILIEVAFFATSTQYCEIKFHSYGYTVKDYTLMWDRGVDGEVKKDNGSKILGLFG